MLDVLRCRLRRLLHDVQALQHGALPGLCGAGRGDGCNLQELLRHKLLQDVRGRRVLVREPTVPVHVRSLRVMQHVLLRSVLLQR